MTTIFFLILLLTMTFTKLIIQGSLLVHRIQQLGYSNLKLIKWLEGRQYREVLSWNIFELLFPLLIILILYYNIKEIPLYKYLTSTIMILTFSWKLAHPFLSKWVGKKNAKVPLVYTARVKRLIATEVILTFFLLLFVFFFTATPLDNFTLSTWGFFRFNSFILLISIIIPVIVLASNLINLPIEGLIHYYYFQTARRKILKAKLINIGITGSYGKTSTKFFLSSILSAKFKILFTPASYNTPMGISKVINQNDLSDYSMFVAEMGADKFGDINELCKLIKPDYGIITAIDNQHLETFLSVENIVKTKLSLFNNIKEKGFGIYNYDSVLLRNNINKDLYNIPIYSYSINIENLDKVDIVAQNVRHSKDGLEFNATFKDKSEIKIRTDLLGMHNVSNLLACIPMLKVVGIK